MKTFNQYLNEAEDVNLMNMLRGDSTLYGEVGNSFYYKNILKLALEEFKLPTEFDYGITKKDLVEGKRLYDMILEDEDVEVTYTYYVNAMDDQMPDAEDDLIGSLIEVFTDYIKSQLNDKKMIRLVRKYAKENPHHAKDFVKVFPVLKKEFGDEADAGEAGLL